MCLSRLQYRNSRQPMGGCEHQPMMCRTARQQHFDREGLRMQPQCSTSHNLTALDWSRIPRRPRYARFDAETECALAPTQQLQAGEKGGGACRQRQVRRVSAIAVLEFCTVRKKVNCAGLIQGSSDPKAQLGKAVSPVSTHANRWSRSPAAPSGPHDFPPVSTPSARHSSAVCECDTQGGRKPSYPSEN
jgi:hypothetical protein